METSLAVPQVRIAPPAATQACTNCDAPRMGEYCFACGQHFLEGRLTLRRLLVDALVRKLGLEGGLLRTIVDLSTRPAAMMRNYVDGRRQRYTNPVGYLMLTTGAYLLLSGLWKQVMIDGVRAQNERMEGLDTEALVQVQMYVEAHPALMTVILSVFLVPLLRLLFFRTTTTAEATIFSLYISAHLMLMQIAINIGALLFSAQPYRIMSGWVATVPVLVLFFAAGRFFGTRFSSFLRLVVALTGAVIGLVLLMFIASVVVSEWAAITQAAAAGG